ncbi:MAG: hypothetical protein KC635_24425, partial [Myxococcales bacterium]|nr:hypothetical protein [Myxococcales bacterium]
MSATDRRHALAVQHYEAAEELLEYAKPELALANYRQAAEALEGLADPPLEARCWTRAGAVALDLGDVAAARAHLADAVAVERAAGLDR